MVRHRSIITGLVCAGIVAACGSTTSPPPRRTGAVLATGGEAAKSPRQILADGAAALRRVRGFVAAGTLTLDQQQPLRIELRVHDTHSLEMDIASYGTSAELIVVPGSSYVRGNTGFWISRIGPRGSLLADRWIQVPPATAATIVGSVRNLSPASMSRCFTEHHGRLTVVGQASIEGHPAVLVRDAGDVPGSTPEEIAVSTSGPAYPLALRVIGAQHPGGRRDACNTEDETDAVGTLTFGQFGAVEPIKPPARATRFGHTAST
jgi:hypothetical protein